MASEPCATGSSPIARSQSDQSTYRPSFVFAHPLPSYFRSISYQHRSSPITPIPEDAVADVQSPVEEVDSPEANHEIKSSLTDLLNSESVKRDAKTRLAVQTRLMEAEMELKRQRRRKAGSRSRVSSPALQGE
ncbi:hypothetical protein MBLNU230_g5834t1 [Neophaeotheca triangularis]